MNVRQYERGALLVIPVNHAASVLDLDPQQAAAVHVETARLRPRIVSGVRLHGTQYFSEQWLGRWTACAALSRPCSPALSRQRSASSISAGGL